MDTNRFSEALAAFRQAESMTRDDLARAAGLTAAGLAYLEAGKRRPSLETALALAKALGRPVDSFLVPIGAAGRSARNFRKREPKGKRDAAHFAANLYHWRTDRGMSRDDLARAAGLTVSTLENLEQGRRRPTLDTAAALAFALYRSVDEMARPRKARKRGRGER